MKTILTIISFATALLANGVAYAIPMTWTDTYSPESTPILLNANNTSHAWTHDLTDDGFIPGLGSGDFITDYTITLNVFDDQDRYYEFATFVQPGFFGSNTFEVDYTDVVIGMTFVGWITLNLDGMLDVSLSRRSGDFYFGGSTLVANGFSKVASVPEPGTLALLAVGLLIAGFGGRGMRSLRPV